MKNNTITSNLIIIIIMLYIKCSLHNDECESFSPKGKFCKGATCEVSEASPPTKCNTKGNYP